MSASQQQNVEGNRRGLRVVVVFIALTSAALLVLAFGLWQRYQTQSVVSPVANIPADTPGIRDNAAGSYYSDSEPPSVWQSFVIDGERLKYYDGRTSVQLQTIQPDVVEIIVDAFPRPPSVP